MSDQVLIKSDYATSRPIELFNTIDSTGLRVYRDTPFTINVQIRTKTDKRGRISGLSISRKEAIEVAEYLMRKAEELTDEGVTP